MLQVCASVMLQVGACGAGLSRCPADCLMPARQKRCARSHTRLSERPSVAPRRTGNRTCACGGASSSPQVIIMSTARAVALIVLVVVACRDASSPLQPRPRYDATGVIPEQYIVVFQDAVTDPVGLAQSLVAAQHGVLLYTYTSGLKGFAAGRPDAAAAVLGQDPLVAYVEPDRVASMSGTQQMDANGDPWGLDRIDQRALPLSGTYTYASTGAGVHVYLIDTGIWTSHPEFEGRADIVYNNAGGDGQDCSGHGTAVAGVVGSATYGVAKQVFLHGVRVGDCNGSATTSQIIAGVDWVTANHQAPAVANYPVQTDPSAPLATAIKNLWDSGVFVGTTAGNHSEDACLEASGATPFAVAASTRTDAKADFSNFGACVKIYAPGENIKSTWLGGSTNTVSGTSFAAPHVTAVAALYKATFGDAPSDTVAKWILNNATAGVITGDPPGTPNLLLYSPATAPPAPVASFTFSCSGLTCSFDASSSTAQASATYSWSWGDGASGTGTTATHAYAAGGSYSVALTVTDGGGSSTKTQTVTVTAPVPAPVPSFTFSCSGLTCSFDASSSTAQASATYSWSWGDGASGTGRTATHAYAAGGSYSVTLTVTDGGGSSTKTQTVVAVAPAVRLVFTVQPRNALPYPWGTIQPPVQVTAVDALGNRVASYTGLVTIAIGRNAGLLLPGTLRGTTGVAAVNGVATFSNLSIDQPGIGYTLVATASGLTGVESASFTILTP